MFSATAAATAAFPLSNPSAFIGGGQIGYNYQFANRIVAGLEGDVQKITGGRQSGSIFQAAPTAGFPGDFRTGQIVATKKLDYIATVRGRLGYELVPALLVYATGGLAVGSPSSTLTVSQIPIGPGVGGVNTPYSGAGGTSSVRAGYTVGGGLEYKLTPT